MSRTEKILKRLLSYPTDFTWQELKVILLSFGYNEHNAGKTSGSRVTFHNDQTNHIIRLHKPHPTDVLKRYQLDSIIEELKSKGVINEG